PGSATAAAAAIAHTALRGTIRSAPASGGGDIAASYERPIPRPGQKPRTVRTTRLGSGEYLPTTKPLERDPRYPVRALDWGTACIKPQFCASGGFPCSPSRWTPCP